MTAGDSNGPATVPNGNGNGLFTRTNWVGPFENSGTKITGNTGWVILCAGSPSNPLIYSTVGSFGTVSGTGEGQIACNLAP